MDVQKIILGVDVSELAKVSGVPRRTLYRWAKEGRIAGREEEQKLWADKIKLAASKLKKRARAA